MTFEWDPKKSADNRTKHGLSFEEAVALWAGPTRKVKTRHTEPRWLITGKISDRHWTAVVTYRGERIRIISVRRARKKEVAAYEAR